MGVGWQQIVYPKLWSAHNAFSFKKIEAHLIRSNKCSCVLRSGTNKDQEFDVLTFPFLTMVTPEPKAASPPEAPADEGHAAAKPTPRWKTYGTPLLVLLLAIAVLVTITRNWNSWEGGHIE